MHEVVAPVHQLSAQVGRHRRRQRPRLRRQELCRLRDLVLDYVFGWLVFFRNEAEVFFYTSLSFTKV